MKTYGLLGDPVDRSLSPAMMNAAFKHLGIDAVYIPIRIPAGEIGQAFDMMRLFEMEGVNITAPHKTTAAQLMDKLIGPAGAVKVVNTVVREGRSLAGHNTDISGLMRFEVPSGGAALVIGAGGAARAACFVLRMRGTHIHVMNRTPSKAARLAVLFSCTACMTCEVTPDILVNATPLPLEELAKMTPMPRETIINYPYTNDDERILTEARAAGIRVIDGLDLLLYQGMDAFELWTGVSAPEQVMKEAIEHCVDRIYGSG